MIGYYAHGEGSGHCNSAQILGRFIGDQFIVFTDRAFDFRIDSKIVRLPDEGLTGDEFDIESFPKPRALHYAPIGLQKITKRNAIILDAVLKKNISLLIIDVSVEIAMLCRVSSIPYIYVRLQGNRNDLGHLNAFEGAVLLLAYFPECMESDDTPYWVRKKTYYVGFVSKFMTDRNTSTRPKMLKRNGKPNLVCLSGYGSRKEINLSGLHKIMNIYKLGPSRNEVSLALESSLGIVPSIKPYVQHADVIIASCGANITAEILHLGKKFLAIEERRHYDEHFYMSKNLFKNGWAVPLSKYTSVKAAILDLQSYSTKIPPRPEIHLLISFCTWLKKRPFQPELLLNKTSEIIKLDSPNIRKRILNKLEFLS